jgi:hypothetical protein
VFAGHANSQTAKLYDRRSQKVLLEDMEGTHPNRLSILSKLWGKIFKPNLPLGVYPSQRLKGP